MVLQFSAYLVDHPQNDMISKLLTLLQTCNILCIKIIYLVMLNFAQDIFPMQFDVFLIFSIQWNLAGKIKILHENIEFFIVSFYSTYFSDSDANLS